MSNFSHKNFLKDDDYSTPSYVWEDIKEFIPKDKVIYEPFYLDGKSGEILKELGFNVIHECVDYFTNEFEYDIIVSNPSFSNIKEVLNKLHDDDKPFILLMPTSKINTQYFRKWRNKNIQIIIPKKRIAFIKNKVQTKSCNFDCLYYCYKMNLPNDITFIE